MNSEDSVVGGSRPLCKVPTQNPVPGIYSLYCLGQFSCACVTVCQTTQQPSWAWWQIPVIPALKSLRQEDCKLKGIMGYTVSRYLRNCQLFSYLSDSVPLLVSIGCLLSSDLRWEDCSDVGPTAPAFRGVTLILTGAADCPLSSQS